MRDTNRVQSKLELKEGYKMRLKALAALTLALMLSTSFVQTVKAQGQQEVPIYEQSVRDLTIEVQPKSASGVARAESAPSGRVPVGGLWRFGTAATTPMGVADVGLKLRMRAPMPPKEYKGEEIGKVVLRIEGKAKIAALAFTGILGFAFAGHQDLIVLENYEDWNEGLEDFAFSLPSSGTFADFLVHWINDTTIELALLLGKCLGDKEEVNFFWDFPLDFIPLESLPLGKEVEIELERTYRAVVTGIGTAFIGGDLKIEKASILGFTTRGETLPLKFWNTYTQEGKWTTSQLVSVEPYSYGTEVIVDGLRTPQLKKRGKIYTVFAGKLWRLKAIELDDDPSTHLTITGDSFTYPVRMDKGHKLTFYFERAVADLIVAGFRTDPPSSSLQQGQEFQLNVLVRNVGELSAQEASRSSPLSGDYKLRIRVNGRELTLPERGLEAQGEPGDSRELFAGTWTAPFASTMTIEATIDVDDEIDEGISGEQNNTASLDVYLAAPTLPDPAFKNPRDPKGEVGFEQLGDTVLRLWADVTNLSPVPASNVEVVFSIDEPLPVGAMTIGKTTIPYLPGNSVRRAWVEWNVCKVPAGPHRVGVGIDPDNKIQELNERNNNTGLTVTIPASANKAKLTTDKFTYQSGEVVTIRFFNGCSQTISLHDSAPWVIKDSQGRVIFAPTALQVITEVRPGETKTWTWNQKDNNGRQVPVGTYTVELKTMDAGTYTASFEIKALVQAKLDVKAVAEISWPIPTRIEISVLVLVNGIPMSTPASQLFPINGLVSLTALQQEVNVPPFGTFYFKQWECESPARGREVFRTPTIMFTLGEDTVCTVVYEKE
jgi:hypothetical protein